MDYQAALSQKKLEFIQQIVSEKSLDTLRAWLELFNFPFFVTASQSTYIQLVTE